MTGIKVEKLGTKPLTPGQLQHAFWDVILCTPRSMSRGEIEEQFNRAMDQLDEKDKLDDELEEVNISSDPVNSYIQPPEGSIKIACDGSCPSNPGPGGWAFVAHDGNSLVYQHSGYKHETTNNRMELHAAITALFWASSKYNQVSITVDSKYVRDGITKWIHRWRNNGWRTAARKSVKNKDLWTMLDDWMQELDVEWHWVRGHDGHIWNEMADRLAGEAAKGA
jgi:ribonuclease HI